MTAAVEKKTCIQCKKTKSEKQFRVKSGERRDVCKNCERKNVIEVQTRKLRKEYGTAVAHIEGDLKHCRACDVVHPIDDFRKNNTADGRYSKCGACDVAGKPLMTNAELAEHRKATVDIHAEDITKSDTVVTEVLNTVEDAAEDVVEAIGEAKQSSEEIAEEVKSFWTRLKAMFKRLF